MTRPALGLRIKRGFDIAGAAAGLVLFLPVLGVTALGVAATMGRPVLFAQERPGYRGRIFTMYKFRTMRSPAPGEAWFRTDDTRLTRLGRFLRATSIDELPELWNVLRGEMSLVGPRPLLVEYLAKYTPEENRRHDVRPGITGWAQVNGRQNIPFSKRLQLDVWYVDHWSLALDAKIIFQTMTQVFVSSGVLSGQNVDEVDDIGLSADRGRNPPEAS